MKMVFEITGKVALVTGGANGIGLCHVKELLRQGVKGVTIADVNESEGKKVIDEIGNEFGRSKAVFVKADVCNKEDFENAFQKTVECFKHVDILINNAGIFNDAIWEREIDINVKGTVNGIILGMEKYLRNHKQNEEAVIVNTSAVGGLIGQALCPVYGATKFAVTGLTQSWGNPFHYERTGVRVVAVYPGATDTQIHPDREYLISQEYEKCWPASIKEVGASGQKPQHVSKEVARIIKFAKPGTLWVVEDNEPAYEFIQPNRNMFKDNILKE